ncbi:MAG TPA: stage III sporulation protein AF [Thermaerobacter sp.]
MGALSEWIRQVVLVLILTGVVELALPPGTMRRYVQVVLGLLVLLAIIRPVLTWLGGEPARLVPAWERILEQAASGPAALGGSPPGAPPRVDASDLETAQDRTRSLALDLHRQRLVTLIREEVRNTTGLEPLAIDLDLVTDPGSPQWGAVLGLALHLPAWVAVDREPHAAPARRGGSPMPGAGADPSPAAQVAGGPGAGSPRMDGPAAGGGEGVLPGAIRPVEPVRIAPIGPGQDAAGAAPGRGADPTPGAGGRVAPLSEASRQSLAARVRQAVAARLDLAPAAVRVVWVEAVEGGDAGARP